MSRSPKELSALATKQSKMIQRSYTHMKRLLLEHLDFIEEEFVCIDETNQERRTSALRRGSELLLQVGTMIAENRTVPRIYMQAIGEGFLEFSRNKSAAEQLAGFAKVMNIHPHAGRPTDRSSRVHSRATAYWTARCDGLNRNEALKVAAERHHVNVREIERAIKKCASAKMLHDEIFLYPVEADFGKAGITSNCVGRVERDLTTKELEERLSQMSADELRTFMQRIIVLD